MIKHDEQSRTKTPEQTKPAPAKDVELDVQELEEKIAPMKTLQ